MEQYRPSDFRLVTLDTRREHGAPGEESLHTPAQFVPMGQWTKQVFACEHFASEGGLFGSAWYAVSAKAAVLATAVILRMHGMSVHRTTMPGPSEMATQAGMAAGRSSVT